LTSFSRAGLGDSNYDSYQGFPNSIHERLLQLGAKEFYGRGKADEATGLEAVVEPWITDLWDDLSAFVETQSRIVAEAAKQAATEPVAPVAPVEVAAPAPRPALASPPPTGTS
jgi:methionine synthase reductase